LMRESIFVMLVGSWNIFTFEAGYNVGGQFRDRL
jgi:hypothetical protein